MSAPLAPVVLIQIGLVCPLLRADKGYLDLTRSAGTHLSTSRIKKTLRERTLVVWATPKVLDEQVRSLKSFCIGSTSFPVVLLTAAREQCCAC
jgi:hypothetical protein